MIRSETQQIDWEKYPRIDNKRQKNEWNAFQITILPAAQFQKLSLVRGHLNQAEPPTTLEIGKQKLSSGLAQC